MEVVKQCESSLQVNQLFDEISPHPINIAETIAGTLRIFFDFHEIEGFVKLWLPSCSVAHEKQVLSVWREHGDPIIGALGL
jgi:hypothetical protein